WQDLFVDAGRFSTRGEARAFAQRLAAGARAGGEFAGRAKHHDNGDSPYRGGDGNGRRRGEIRPIEAEPILFQMRDGEIGPILETTNGFHVVRLIKRDYQGVMPFDDKTQAAIRRKLQNETFEREV